jgi:hypothetical protein
MEVRNILNALISSCRIAPILGFFLLYPNNAQANLGKEEFFNCEIRKKIVDGIIQKYEECTPKQADANNTTRVQPKNSGSQNVASQGGGSYVPPNAQQNFPTNKVTWERASNGRDMIHGMDIVERAVKNYMRANKFVECQGQCTTLHSVRSFWSPGLVKEIYVGIKVDGDPFFTVWGMQIDQTGSPEGLRIGTSYFPIPKNDLEIAAVIEANRVKKQNSLRPDPTARRPKALFGYSGNYLECFEEYPRKQYTVMVENILCFDAAAMFDPDSKKCQPEQQSRLSGYSFKNICPFDIYARVNNENDRRRGRIVYETLVSGQKYEIGTVPFPGTITMLSKERPN